MSVHEKHQHMMVDNRLRRIENRLRRMEILFLKNISKDKRLKHEIDIMEKEEKVIEKEQKVLEQEEKDILKEMKYMEEEEKWHMQVQYNCRFKVMSEKNNEIMCTKTGKLCAMDPCPLWKNGKQVASNT